MISRKSPEPAKNHKSRALCCLSECHRSANTIRHQTSELSSRISVQLSPVFTNRKLNDDLKPLKQKSALVNKQKVVYHFQGDQCEAGYVSYTSRHLHQRVDEHRVKTTIGEHTRKPGSDISSLPRFFSI